MRLLKIATILTASILPVNCQTPANGGFKYFGEWSNVVVSQSEDPHASGYTLQLWKNNGKLVGFLSEFVGPPADPPIGPLQDVTLDPNSGKFSFSAKLTTGVTFSPGHRDGAPSRTLYKFDGVLSESEVKGIFEKEDHLDNTPSTRLEATLERKREPTTDSYWNQKTFREWEEFFAPIVRARGPKW
jgi:hypothetical protein